MTTALRLLSSPDDVARALVSAAEWATEFDLCTPAVDSRLGRWPVWSALLQSERRLRHAFVALDRLTSEPHAVEYLHRLGSLRLVPAADGSFRSHLFRFRRGDRVRVISGAGSFVPEGVMAPLAAVTVWEGDELGPYAIEAERLFTEARRLAHVPELDDLARYAALYFDASVHRKSLTEIGAPLIRRTACDGELLDLNRRWLEGHRGGAVLEPAPRRRADARAWSGGRESPRDRRGNRRALIHLRHRGLVHEVGRIKRGLASR